MTGLHHDEPCSSPENEVVDTATLTEREPTQEQTEAEAAARKLAAEPKGMGWSLLLEEIELLRREKSNLIFMLHEAADSIVSLETRLEEAAIDKAEFVRQHEAIMARIKSTGLNDGYSGIASRRTTKGFRRPPKSAVTEVGQMAASNSFDCFRECVGKKVVGVLRDAMPPSRRARGTKTLVFDDGSGLTIASNGSYWLERSDEIDRAISQRRKELEANERDIQDVLDLAGVR